MIEKAKEHFNKLMPGLAKAAASDGVIFSVGVAASSFFSFEAFDHFGSEMPSADFFFDGIDSTVLFFSKLGLSLGLRKLALLFSENVDWAPKWRGSSIQLYSDVAATTVATLAPLAGLMINRIGTPSGLFQSAGIGNSFIDIMNTSIDGGFVVPAVMLALDLIGFAANRYIESRELKS